MPRYPILSIRMDRIRRRVQRKSVKPSSNSSRSSWIIGIILGALFGLLISEYYHKETKKEYRIGLLQNAIFEAEMNLHHPFYADYIDTLGSLTAGHPFKYLRDLSFKELYKNIQFFQIDDSLERTKFIDLILLCNFEIETFNDGVRVRNDWIVRNPKTTKNFNPYIYEDYYESVRPTLEKFINYGRMNETLLTN